METHKQFLLLQLRNAIADKEWNIACANMETARGGWTCDWYEGMREADSRVQSLTQSIAAIGGHDAR